jgi:peptide/nickel transport system substrate-binding protein
MREKGLSRRAFLTGSAAAAGVAGLALAGCGGSTSSKATKPAASSAATSGAQATTQPKKGGVISVDAGAPVPTSVVTGFAGSNAILRQGLWNGLIMQGADNKARLMLAETFELKPDFSGAHIKLRPNLEFHSGRPITADDVRASIEYFRAPSSVSQLAEPGRYITDIKIADTLTLDLSFVGPRPLMQDYFALLPIVDSQSVDQVPQMKAINGSGPFKFVSYTPNQGYVMERFPNYWDSGKPYLDRIEGKIYADDQSRLLALQTGELLLSTATTYDMTKKLQSNSGIKLENVGSGSSWYAGLVVTDPALKDARVRRALSLAVNRKRIASDWADGLFQPQVLPWPKDSPAYVAADEALVTYDPAQANSLLQQAGAGGAAVPIQLVQSAQTIAQFVQNDWKAAGINAPLALTEDTVFNTQLRNRKFQSTWLATFGFANLMVPASFFVFNQVVRVPNASNYGPQSYQDLLAQIIETDPRSPQGQDLLHQWNRLYLVDDPWVVPLAPTNGYIAMQKKVQAPIRAPLSEYWIS